jgi:hypothetical protein
MNLNLEREEQHPGPSSSAITPQETELSLVEETPPQQQDAQEQTTRSFRAIKRRRRSEHEDRALVLPWQFRIRWRAEQSPAMRASDWRDEVSEQLPDDGATHGGQAWLRWRSAAREWAAPFSPVRRRHGAAGAGGRRMPCRSSAHVGASRARIVPRSAPARVPA